MARYLVVTTVKPPIPPLDSDTTLPVAHRIYGDPNWENVNGWCKYLSKYPNTYYWQNRKSAQLLPVAGLEFQSEHIAANVVLAGAAAATWITGNFTLWGVPALWGITAQKVYTMVSDVIGAADINRFISPIDL